MSLILNGDFSSAGALPLLDIAPGVATATNWVNEVNRTNVSISGGRYIMRSNAGEHAVGVYQDIASPSSYIGSSIDVMCDVTMFDNNLSTCSVHLELDFGVSTVVGPTILADHATIQSLAVIGTVPIGATRIRVLFHSGIASLGNSTCPSVDNFTAFVTHAVSLSDTCTVTEVVTVSNSPRILFLTDSVGFFENIRVGQDIGLADSLLVQDWVRVRKSDPEAIWS